MKIVTNEGVTAYCNDCGNDAIVELELCFECAVIEGIEI